jgi:hypothetical protein
MIVNHMKLHFFNPLRLPATATSPEFGGGREGVWWEIAFKDANNSIDCYGMAAACGR